MIPQASPIARAVATLGQHTSTMITATRNRPNIINIGKYADAFTSAVSKLLSCKGYEIKLLKYTHWYCLLCTSFCNRDIGFSLPSLHQCIHSLSHAHLLLVSSLSLSIHQCIHSLITCSLIHIVICY